MLTPNYYNAYHLPQQTQLYNKVKPTKFSGRPNAEQVQKLENVFSPAPHPNITTNTIVFEHVSNPLTFVKNRLLLIGDAFRILINNYLKGDGIPALYTVDTFSTEQAKNKLLRRILMKLNCQGYASIIAKDGKSIIFTKANKSTISISSSDGILLRRYTPSPKSL